MSRCVICDSMMESEMIDPRDGRPVPCSECLEVIQEAIEEPSEVELVDMNLGFGEFEVPAFFMNGVK